jgi:O-antigen/teichoic acid export membrane protein
MSHKVAITAMSSRFVQAVGMLAVIPLITTKLTPAEQGYYYTFISLGALQVFAEMGMTGVVVQSIAHEAAHLKLNESSEGSKWYGPISNKERLASVMRFAFWWFAIAGIIAALVLSIGGYVFLKTADHQQSTVVCWSAPWLALSGLTGVSIWMTGALSVMEGFGLIGKAMTIRLIGSVVGLIGFISALILNAGLWAPVVNIALFFTCNIILLTLYLKKPIHATLKEKCDSDYRWKNEIWPIQWRIALSWMSGWFIFQAMTPAIMKFEGPVAAGRFGLALQLVNGVQNLSSVWTQARFPAWGMIIAKKSWEELDRDFYKNVGISLGMSVIGSLLLILGIAIVNTSTLPISKRLPEVSVLLILLISAILNQWVFGIAGYLRAHKKEPFLITSIIFGIIMFLGINIPNFVNEINLSLYFSACNIFIGGFIGTYIWIYCKNIWHKSI